MNLGWLRDASAVIADARLAAMATGRIEDHRLLPARYLADAQASATAAFASLGVPVDDLPALVRRFDLAAEILFPEARDGIAFLSACERGLTLPRLTQRPYKAPGESRLLGVEWITAKGREARVRLYEAGVQHGTHSAGHRLRLEVEVRRQGRQRPTIAQLAQSDLGAEYRNRLHRWVSDSQTLVVSGPSDLSACLRRAIREGRVSRLTAERLYGTARFHADDPDLYDARQRRRLYAELRALGAHADLGGDTHVEVDLGPMLSGLVEAWSRPEGIGAPIELAEYDLTSAEDERAADQTDGQSDGLGRAA